MKTIKVNPRIPLRKLEYKFIVYALKGLRNVSDEQYEEFIKKRYEKL